MAQRKRHTGQFKVRVAVEAIYPKPRLSQPVSQEHRKYPYLLRGLVIERPNHVWAADITYIRLWRGFVYLVAIMDWHSRYLFPIQQFETLHIHRKKAEK